MHSSRMCLRLPSMKRSSVWPQKLTLRASSWIVGNHRDSPWEWKGPKLHPEQIRQQSNETVSKRSKQHGLDGGRLLLSVEALHFVPDEFHTHPSLEHQLKVEGQRVQMGRFHIGAQDARRVLEELFGVSYRHVESLLQFTRRVPRKLSTDDEQAALAHHRSDLEKKTTKSTTHSQERAKQTLDFQVSRTWSTHNRERKLLVG